MSGPPNKAENSLRWTKATFMPSTEQGAHKAPNKAALLHFASKQELEEVSQA